MKKAVLSAALSAAMFAAAVPVIAQTTPQEATSGATQNAPEKPYGRHHRHPSPIGYMSRKLNLSQQQQDQLKPIFQKQREQMQAIRKDTTLTADQKKQKIEALHQEFQPQVNGVLTPEQQQQWQQVKAQGKPQLEERRQAMGSARMAQKLNLSAQQQEQIKPLMEKRREQAKAIWQDNSLTADQKKQKMQALNQETRAQMNTILTPEQQQQMQQMRENFKQRRHGHGPAGDAQPATPGA
jgi:Spy/CpxP family protein refolding chaperone